MVLGLLGVAVAAMEQSRPFLYAVIPVCVVGFASLTPSLQSLLSRRSDAAEQGGILGVGQGIAAIARILGPVVGISLFYKATKWPYLGGATWPYWFGAAVMAFSIFLVAALRGAPPLE